MITLLRTLTKKSKFGFGEYPDKTVQDLLNIKNYSYISWIYYNMSNITFTDDILDEIKIFDDRRIMKPGKKPELHCNNLLGSRTLKKYKLDSHYKKESKTSKKLYTKQREKIWFNKAANAWKNQGH